MAQNKAKITLKNEDNPTNFSDEEIKKVKDTLDKIQDETSEVLKQIENINTFNIEEKIKIISEIRNLIKNQNKFGQVIEIYEDLYQIINQKEEILEAKASGKYNLDDNLKIKIIKILNRATGDFIRRFTQIKFFKNENKYLLNSIDFKILEGYQIDITTIKKNLHNLRLKREIVIQKEIELKDFNEMDETIKEDLKTRHLDKIIQEVLGEIGNKLKLSKSISLISIITSNTYSNAFLRLQAISYLATLGFITLEKDTNTAIDSQKSLLEILIIKKPIKEIRENSSFLIPFSKEIWEKIKKQ